MFWYNSPPKKEVKGGIKAHSERGEIGQSWWANRWNQVIKGYDIGERYNRGRNYARKGQVSAIKTQKGSISAVVHGSWKYNVNIEIKTIDKKTWEKITKAIFSRPLLIAKLLAGQMPVDIEDVFSEVNIDLFPKESDLTTYCTCMDWSNPCKHIVAVYLLLAEEFDRDPFMLFNLRGITRKELLNSLGITGNVKIPKMKNGTNKPPKLEKLVNKKLHFSNPDTFWGNHNSTISTGEISIPAMDAVLVKQLGGFPFWRGSERFIPTMEKIYGDSSKIALDTFLEQSSEDTDDKLA